MRSVSRSGRPASWRAMAMVCASGAAASVASAQNCLQTTFANNNNGAGLWTVYFDATVNVPITVTALDVNTNAGVGLPIDVTVYLTAPGGTYVGNTSTPSAWTQVSAGAGISAGVGQPSAIDVSDFPIPPGTYGVAIRYGPTTTPMYTNGTGSNQTYSNPDLTLNLGAAQATTTAPFTGGSPFSPRVWNGRICYTGGTGGGSPLASLKQLSFVLDGVAYPDTEYGTIDFTYMGKPIVQYFNLSYGGNWVLQNMPLVSREGCVNQTQNFSFNLGNPRGTNIVGTPSASMGYSLTDAPVAAGPAPNTPPMTVGGDTRTMEKGVEPSAGAQLPPASPSQGTAPVAAQPMKAAHKNFPNQDCGVNECTPVSVSNSLMFLKDKNPNAAWGMLGIDLATMKTATKWKVPPRMIGCYIDDNPNGNAWWKDKDAYMMANRYPVQTMKVGTMAEMLQALKDMKDVELQGGWHTAAIVGMTDLGNGKYSIDVAHDTKQGMAGGTQVDTIEYDPATNKFKGSPGFFDGSTFNYGVVEMVPTVKKVFNGPAVPIPDGSGSTGCGTSGAAVITVPETGTITSVMSAFHVAHTFQGDLTVRLTKVGGPTVVLVDRPGVPQTTFGFAADNYGGGPGNLFISNGGGDTYDVPKIADPGYANIEGPWKAEGPLSAFAGLDASGTWMLEVQDCAGGDVGSILWWELSLVMGAEVTGGSGCYANCDGSTIVPFLNVNDFVCFLNRFSGGDTYANCDQSTIPPVLNINDFICFNNKFAMGCSAP
ncbi:MAG: proprotein convertase P-domain-containing protein [Phycisphaerae bacterium]|nr:proprotein convertase P-domain-containing protein [Phycisphaerae bacterium]